MVIVKVKGDVTVASGVTVAPYYDTNYGGPKGFTLYVTGKLENNGTIDNSHGAKAVGQNVYLWKNADGTYEYVPAEGAAGGARQTGGYKPGNPGVAGIDRQTGGGGSGSRPNTGGSSGAGGSGTSYSGGAGGGLVYQGTGGSGVAGNGSSEGGAGGAAVGSTGGGSGNPGKGSASNGTGGLLTIYANEYKNNGIIKAMGATGGNVSNRGGGSSGGGSINIFSSSEITSTGTANANGGSAVGSSYKGGAGGKGTVTYTQIDINSTETVVSEVETPNTKVNAPIINVSNTDNIKTITIEYPEGYTNEYSLDLGASWTPYINPVRIDKNTTIIARVKSGDEIISSSSFTVTTFETVEEKEETQIPDEFIEGEDYILPTTCKINDIVYNNINELSEGSYNLVCELTNGEEPLVNKTILIKKREEALEE